MVEKRKKIRWFKKFNWFKISILIVPLLISFFFILTPFEESKLIFVNTPLILNESDSKTHIINYNYGYLGETDSIKFGEDKRFYITNDELTQNTIKSIFNNIFDVPLGLGWHKICYHNIDTKFYLCGKETTLNSPTVFTFFKDEPTDEEKRHIYAYSGQTICENHYTRDGFGVIINNKVDYPPINEIQKYAEENDISNCPDFKPTVFNAITAEIYVKPIFWIILTKNFLFFLVVSGTILLLKEIWKFIQK